MKFRSILTSALLGTAALLVSAAPSKAALTYTAGDLFLGFRSPDSAQDYLVNIGNVSQFSNLSPGATVYVNTGGSIAANLNTAFSSGWFGSGSVFWSISGTPYDGASNLTPTIYATKNRSNPAVQSSPWVGRAEVGQTGSVSSLQSMKSKYVTEGSSAGTAKATFQNSASSNSYARFTDDSFTGTGSDFGIGGSIEGVAGASTVLDFYRIDPAAGKASTYLGYFTLASDGAVTFTAVPEPSIVGLIFAGGAALFSVIRRKRRIPAIQS